MKHSATNLSLPLAISCIPATRQPAASSPTTMCPHHSSLPSHILPVVGHLTPPHYTTPPPSARSTTSPTPPAPMTPPPSAKKTPCDSLLFSQFFKHSKRSIVRADSLALSQLIVLRAPLNTLSASADIGGMEKISIARRDRSG
jgi:hypothetical protein